MKNSFRYPKSFSAAFFLACALIAAMTLATGTQALSSNQIVKDCIDGVIDGNYTKKELNNAKGEVPADIGEYTLCLDAINDALAKSKGADNKVTDLGVFKTKPVVPDEKTQKKLKKAATGGSKAIKVGNSEVIPGSASMLQGKGLIADLPTSVAVLIGLIGLSMITLTGFSLYRNREGFKKLGRLFKR